MGQWGVGLIQCNALLHGVVGSGDRFVCCLDVLGSVQCTVGILSYTFSLHWAVGSGDLPPSFPMCLLPFLPPSPPLSCYLLSSCPPFFPFFLVSALPPTPASLPCVLGCLALKVADYDTQNQSVDELYKLIASLGKTMESLATDVTSATSGHMLEEALQLRIESLVNEIFRLDKHKVDRGELQQWTEQAIKAAAGTRTGYNCLSCDGVAGPIPLPLNRKSEEFPPSSMFISSLQVWLVRLYACSLFWHRQRLGKVQKDQFKWGTFCSASISCWTGCFSVSAVQ